MIICAWCESVISARPDPQIVAAPTESATSHGICRSCLSHRIAADQVGLQGGTALTAR